MGDRYPGIPTPYQHQGAWGITCLISLIYDIAVISVIASYLRGWQAGGAVSPRASHRDSTDTQISELISNDKKKMYTANRPDTATFAG